MGAMMWPEAVPEAEGRGHRPRAYFSNFHLASGFIYSTSRVFFEKIDFVLGLRPRAKSIFSKNTLLVE